MFRSSRIIFFVVPAKAGTQGKRPAAGSWVPAFAGTTKRMDRFERNLL
jgi:hypothetical protein